MARKMKNIAAKKVRLNLTTSEHRGNMKTSKLMTLLATLTLLATSLSSCSLIGASAMSTVDDFANQSITWEKCDPDLELDANRQGDLFKSVENVDCTGVLVPANYDDIAGSPQYLIKMMRLNTATSENYMGTIFINPGGPGASGIEQLQWSNFPEEITKHYNIIGFDPRGVGSSDFSDGTEIKCSDTLDFRTYFEGEASPASLAEYKASLKLNDEYYQDCVDRNPYWWTLSTKNVVADLEIMRKALLKDEPLNFIGSSYGTTIAGLFVSTYPDSVGKIVLDSPTSSREDLIASALENYKAQEAMLNRLLTYYAGTKGIGVEAAFQELLGYRQLADDDKLVGFAGIVESTDMPGKMVSSESMLIKGIMTMNYLPEEDANQAFAQAMEQLAKGGYNDIFEWYGFTLDGYDPNSLEGATLEDKKITRDNSYEVMTMVNSMDYSPADLTTAEQKSLSAQVKKVAPRWSKLTSDASGYEYFGENLGLDWKKIALADPDIPDPRTEPLERVNESGKQLLIIGSMRESVTPYAFSKETARLLKSPLISVDGTEHAPAASYKSACINQVLVDYFVSNKTVTDKTCQP
ncbi:MAG: alpha/beta hydrolase [Acidobacteria bacterium]|nr:alpha/beta hydrolase [Acidobacteriota bacterium]